MAKEEYKLIMTTNDCGLEKENDREDEYLVDTSVWIEFLNGKPGSAVDQLKTWLTTGKVVGLTATLYQEILQGAASEVHFRKCQTYFSQQSFYHPLDSGSGERRVRYGANRRA